MPGEKRGRLFIENPQGGGSPGQVGGVRVAGRVFVGNLAGGS